MLLGSIAFSLTVSQSALADVMHISNSQCAALATALQPATITAIAGAVVTVLGAIATFIKTLQTRSNNPVQLPAQVSVHIKPDEPPPTLKT